MTPFSANLFLSILNFSMVSMSVQGIPSISSNTITFEVVKSQYTSGIYNSSEPAKFFLVRFVLAASSLKSNSRKIVFS